jgi:hypothetical protein
LHRVAGDGVPVGADELVGDLHDVDGAAVALLGSPAEVLWASSR